MDTSAAKQVAVGNYIAQADRGGIATVSVYEVAAPPPPDEATVTEAVRLLAGIPVDAPAEPASLPYHSRMPLARNPLFTGRVPELLWLSERLGPSTGPVSTVVVAGLGGVGKSQVASEYAHRNGRYYAGGVYWVNLADVNAIDAEIAACGGPEGMQLRPDFLKLSVDEQVRLVRAAWQGPLPRLLIFDNCEDASTLKQWRPSSGGCRVLVTSRRLSWDPALGVEVSELDVLSSADGKVLLEHYRHAEAQEDAKALEDIATELGQLPLALHLAGSYLNRYQRVFTPIAYLDQLRSAPLIDHRSLTAAGISPTDHIQSIAATFALSVDRLTMEQEDDELARQCLIAASYLAPGTPIPRTVLRALLGLSESQDDDITLEDALLRLAELGLVHQGIDGTPRLHRLVAAFVQDRLGSAPALERVELALWNSVSRRQFAESNLVRATYEPHLRALADRALLRGDMRAADLSNVLGLLLKARYENDEAVRYLKQALQIREKFLGVDSPKTAKDLNDLGFAYLGSPRRVLGLPYLERARRLWNANTDALNLAATLDNLGQLHRGAERMDLAEPLFEEAYAIRERELGDDDYRTSVTLFNLAQMAEVRGDSTRAIQLYEKTVRVREALAGQSDPESTALSHMALATTLDSVGNVAAAGNHFRRMAELYREALGPTHPRALWAAVQAARYAVDHGDSSEAAAVIAASGALRDAMSLAQTRASLPAGDLNNFGFALWLTGDYAGARTLYELALTREGVDATALNNLGMIEERLGQYSSAIAYYRRSLALLESQATSRKYSLLRARVLNNLGVSLSLAGETQAGREHLEEALELRTRLQGGGGTDCAVTLRNLGLVAKQEGRLNDARRLVEKARDLLRPTQGTGSAEYARTMRLLGELFAASGDDEGALTALQTAWDVQRSALGPNHPDTAVTLRARATVLRRIGREAEACDALSKAFPVFEQHMGADHPWTLAVQAELARCPNSPAETAD